MATPKTRIPKECRESLRNALECYRDYLFALDNKAGAAMTNDLAIVLGLEPLPHIAELNGARYWNPALKSLVNNRKKYGEK